MAASNPVDYLAIRNTIARYCIALDTKDFGLFDHVFTQDVDTVYPFFEVKGMKDVAARIQKRHAILSPVTTQHALTTQLIEIAADGKTAKATTYFTGVHFGQGKWEGKEVTAWGTYADTLTLTEGQPSLPGSSGQWLISRREVSFTKRLGEEGVMDGE
ncbi:hypothetical protein BAUCODRAFT_75608 [Baudoinia panamericana UAMH 10762]|uniref:SnoaL-like domain-containing protein n=1 Tax=Baudoinia panamericana (strain UAMH 10762) TaxID=717646 RepID=M2MAW8_BAUPA|nr:uncharacterized protein BAUCODRAFT_75608 [Baudoinia panamericana UAMH 10762]EMC93616.1 hypothetical protein BAUCODRAFT_75608 [Baudoinia panamericana UAMH 10762]